jgi:hypothetical protein
MDERRAYLKKLASQSARRWATAPLPAAFAGETRIETKNTVYRLTDGVCHAVTRHEGDDAGRMHPSAFEGMRLVGWLMRDDPQAGIRLDWRAGAYAVLWRPRGEGEEHSAVALTSTSHAFRVVARRSTPPPPPLVVPRATLLPRPSTPSSWVPPVPSSTTRLHLGQVPAAPDTPTPPQRRSSMPPPLPPRAVQGVRPLQARAGT